MSRTLTCLVVAALAAGVAACGTKNPYLLTRTACPAVAVVKYANTLTQFRTGNVGSAADIATTSQIGDVSVSCREETGAKVQTQVAFNISGVGASDVSGDVRLPYFVVVVEDGSKVIAKSTYEAVLNFQNGRAQARQVVSTVTPYVAPPAPLQRKRGNDAPLDEEDLTPKPSKYEVLIGFQLNDAQAVYNIAR